jgi:polysaccharide biosynthesis transport protein
MDSPASSKNNRDPQSPPGGDYGYGGYAGYSAMGYGEGTPHRSLQDYALVLRERIWYIIVVFLVVFSSALFYTLSQTKIYESTATVQIFRRDPAVLQVQSVMPNEIKSAEDLNTQVKLLESQSIIEAVAERLTGDDLRRFMAPYQKGHENDPVTPHGIIARNRKIVPQRLSLMVAVQYRHPDRHIAARVANLFVDEFITYNNRVRIDEAMKAVDDLKLRADQQQKRVEELALELQMFREKNNMVSLDQRRDIVTETLKMLNARVTTTSATLKETQVRWEQLQAMRREGGDISDLPFIASQPLVQTLTQQVAGHQINIAQLSERYRDGHPRMVEARNSLAQTERELTRALDSEASRTRAAFEAARSNFEAAQQALAAQETESLQLDRAAVEYDTKEREYRINEQLLAHIIGRMRETTVSGTMDNQNARVIDRAQSSSEGNYVAPNMLLNLGLGLVGGLGLGLAFAYFIAFIDDRVKSAFDIEGVIGLPLLGIIPQIKKMDPTDKAQIVVNNQDRQVAEAFLALHSALRLKDESKRAKVMLTTSTIPGEGKSFTTTNLALTFAAHGEKTCIVDADLRKPNIHKSFKLDNVKGVIDIVSGGALVDDVLIRDVMPNLDIITTGGRAKNPSQVLNSRNFEVMLTELRQRYDRVFVDTPPLAAVTDALIILPLVDGTLFNIFFNKVRRKAAQFSARKLLESNVPVFGAVLNGLNLAVSGYYYAQYYDKSYRDYYVVMEREEQEGVSSR